jgi:tol-pal system protein YbgF
MTKLKAFPYFALFALVAFSGCLKTRAQLKDEPSGNSGGPMPAQVQEVQPKGEYVIDEIKNEITRLNGRIEDLERAQKQGSQSSDQMKKLETRVTELEQAQVAMLEAMKKAESQPAAHVDQNALVDHAKEQIEGGNFEQAIDSLSTYLKNPKGKRAEEATFLRGEAYFNAKQYKKAIVDYSKFPEKFTKSKKMPQALYKIGLSFDALGMKEDAKGFYQEVLDKFPKSAEAQRAKARLK